MNWSAAVRAEVPNGVVTVTSMAPDPAGLVTTICVAVSLTIVPGRPPKATAVAPARSVPVIVTLVPPAVGPALGLTLVLAALLALMAQASATYQRTTAEGVLRDYAAFAAEQYVNRVEQRLEGRVIRRKRQHTAVVEDHQEPVHPVQEDTVVRHRHDRALEAVERLLERLR